MNTGRPNGRRAACQTTLTDPSDTTLKTIAFLAFVENGLIRIELDRLDVGHQADHLFGRQRSKVVDLTETLEQAIRLSPAFAYDVSSDQSASPEKSAFTLQNKIQTIKE